MKSINVSKWFLKKDVNGRRIPTALTVSVLMGVVFMSYFASQKPSEATKVDKSSILKDKDLLLSAPENLQDKGKEFQINYDNIMPDAQDPLSSAKASSQVRRIGRASKMIVYDASKNYSSQDIVPLGSMVRCLLIHNIVTNNFNAPVIAQVWEDFYFNGEVLLPFGTRIYGTAYAGRQRDRVAVKFHSIVFLDGKTIRLDAIGLSKDGSGGLTGIIINNSNKKMFLQMAVNFLSGLAIGLQDTTTNAVTGLTQIESSSRNAVLNGVANTFEKEAKRIEKEIDDAKGYAVVLAGSELIVYFEKEADISPL